MNIAPATLESGLADEKAQGKLEAMKENQIASAVVECAYKIHTELGPGIFEVVYEATLAHELRERGYAVERQVPVPIIWDGIRFDEGYRADLIVDDCVLIEIKSIQAIEPVHRKQVLTYLRLADKRLGLLTNFGEELIKNGIKRIVNGLPEEIIEL